MMSQINHLRLEQELVQLFLDNCKDHNSNDDEVEIEEVKAGHQEAGEEIKQETKDDIHH